MNNELRNQIYNELNLREIEDLLKIWQKMIALNGLMKLLQ